MKRKKYISLTGIQYTFPVRTGGTLAWISFKGSENDFVTSDRSVQAAIEAHPKFLKGEIGLYGCNDEPCGDAPEPEVYEEVSDIGQAADVLAGEPYRVAKKNLKRAGDIRQAMQTCRVVFPNLVFSD